jgi:hypothetical protein
MLDLIVLLSTVIGSDNVRRRDYAEHTAYQTDRVAWGRNRARLAQSDIAATSI